MITQCCQLLNKRAKRSGGLLCYIKEVFVEGIQEVNGIVKNDDRLWLKLSSNFFGFPRDLYVRLAYITPATSTHSSARDNIWQLLNTEIAQFSVQGEIMVTGDFNARTGILSDFNEIDSVKYVPLPPHYKPDLELVRSNLDHFVNHYGKELLNMCISCNLRIVNGRIGKDKNIGSFTCYTTQGCSVVDYFAVSENLLQFIMGMEVCDLLEHSDHCPIFLNIVIRKWKHNSVKCDKYHPNTVSDPSHRYLPRCNIKWDTSLGQKLRKRFNSHQFLHLLSSLKWEQSSDAIVNNFYSLLISTMETCEGVKH